MKFDPNNLKGDVRITLSIKADFFEESDLDARDGMEHSIRFNIKNPGLSIMNGRKEMGAGEQFGYFIGRLAKEMSDCLCDFDESVIDGFCNGINIFPEEENEG